MGILFAENHFRTFTEKPYSGALLRSVWILGTMLLVMSYHGNLKVKFKVQGKIAQLQKTLQGMCCLGKSNKKTS